MKSAQYTREIPQRYRLESGKCLSCGKIHFPPRFICDECGGTEFETVNLQPEGEIITYTVIHTPAKQFSLQKPFVVAIVQTPDDVRITCQIVDCDAEEVEIGSKVELVFRKVQEEGEAGILCYGYKGVLVRA